MFAKLKALSGFVCALGLGVAFSSAAINAQEMKRILSDDIKALNLPFSDAVQVGNMLYLAGQLGNIPGTLTLVEGGIKAEAHQTMTNIKTVLENSGSNMDHLVRCTVFLADINEWATFNEVYKTFFNGKYPARSAFATNGLAIGARVEVECIAVVPE